LKDGKGEFEQSREQLHMARQMEWTEKVLATGPRKHIVAPDAIARYLTPWRLKKAMRRLIQADKGITCASSVLVLCAAEGNEGSILVDMGFLNVTVSDLSETVCGVAMRRDPRLNALALNAEDTGLPALSFDIVVVQDGLHHLQRPVQGFTEMLRIASRAVIFLEPHDSLVGRLIGTKWETNGPAVNYVFRWTKRLVQDTTSSYLGKSAFQNLSFSFWHHNVVLAKAVQRIGSGSFAVSCIRVAKTCMDILLPRMGNQFCGLVIKKGE
jgi:ubiquinone/menaquinone biosynthesis C-methylase UbiE